MLNNPIGQDSGFTFVCTETETETESIRDSIVLSIVSDCKKYRSIFFLVLTDTFVSGTLLAKTIQL